MQHMLWRSQRKRRVSPNDMLLKAGVFFVELKKVKLEKKKERKRN